MKVLLVNPPIHPANRRRPVVKRLFYNSPPLGIGYLAAWVRERGVDVKLIDAPSAGLGIPEIISHTREFRPQVLGITSTTVSFPNTLCLARAMKTVFPDLKIVVGGPHVSANPASSVASKWIDVGVMGEGEVTFEKLLECFDKDSSYEDLAGICYLNGNRVVVNPRREHIEDLDKVPFPARDLMNLNDYLPMPNDEYRLPKTAMITSRGCIFGCIFCDKSVFGRGYRFQSTERVLAEIDELVHRYGVKDIAFVDSLFFHHESKIFDFAEKLRKKRWDVTWTCSIHVNRVERKLLELMKASGCWRIRIGIESGCQEVLDFINKKTKLEKIRRVARWSEELNLKTKAFIIVGHLIDSRKTIEESIDFVRQLPLKDITVQINTPMINTAQYDMAPEYGRMRDYSPEHLNYWEPVFVPHALTAAELLEFQKKFYRSFYFRPDVMWRHLRDLRSIKDAWRYARAVGLIMSLFFTRKVGGL